MSVVVTVALQSDGKVPCLLPVRPLDLDSSDSGCKIHLARGDKLATSKNRRVAEAIVAGPAWPCLARLARLPRLPRLAGAHTVPGHAVGLLFPAGWASSLVDTGSACAALSWDSRQMPRCLTCTCSWRHLMWPLSSGMEARAASVRGPGRRLGWLGRRDKGHCVYCVWLRAG